MAYIRKLFALFKEQNKPPEPSPNWLNRCVILSFLLGGIAAFLNIVDWLIFFVGD